VLLPAAFIFGWADVVPIVLVVSAPGCSISAEAR